MKRTLTFILVLLLAHCATDKNKQSNDTKSEYSWSTEIVEYDGKKYLNAIDAIIRRVRQKNYDVCVRGKHGETILHTVMTLDLGIEYDSETEHVFKKYIPQITKEHYKLIALILTKGADVNAVNQFGSTPMHYLAKEYLDPGMYRPAFGRHWYRIARLLIRKGADVTIENEDNWTPFHVLLNPYLMYNPISKNFRKQHLKDIKRMELLLKRHMK